MRFHAQNLNERKGITGSILRHGRCWFHFTQNYGKTLGIEWGFWSKRLSFGIGLADGEHALAWHFCIGLLNLYFHIDHRGLHDFLDRITKRPDQKYSNGRNIGFYWMDDFIHIDLWNDPMEHRSVDPKWWSIGIFPKDVFLGKSVYTTRTVRESRIEVPMPERVYMATAKFQESTWKRPRWPWPLRLMKCDITPDVPIPVPGKGENSWDCGEDAVWSTWVTASTDAEAVAAISNSVMSSRIRHGGRQWRPDKVPA